MGSVTCPAVPTATISPAVTGLTFSQFSRGSGVTCASASTGISGSGFNGNLATNLGASKWYTNTITSNASVSFTVSAVSVVSQVSTAAAGNTVEIQYSINGGAKVSIGSFTPTGSSATYNFTPTISVPASSTLDFFFIPYTLSASGTTCRINNATSFTVTTTSSCTPPPTPPNPTALANPSCGATSLNSMTPTAAETWYWQGTSSSGTSTASPATSTYPVSTSGTYYLRAQDNSTLCWSTASSSIVMVIDAAPTVSSHPSNASVVVGSNGSFSVTASGTSLTYQWQEDQGGGFSNLTDGGVYSGSSTSTLTLTGVTSGMNAWQYRCIVSGTCTPSATSNSATLTITTGIDYRTKQNGNWGVNTTWEKWNGSAWVACAVGDFPNSSISNAEVLHIVDQDGSGVPPFDCKDLVVQTGGVVWTNHFTGSNSYLQIYGNITCDGTIGTSTGDDLCFDLAGGINCTISGNGSFYATRIRKDNAINNTLNTTLTIAMDVYLFWSTGSGTILFNDGSSDAMLDVTVNAGKTLRGITAGAVSNNISIDGVSGTDATACGGSFTVYGTIDIDGTFYLTTNNVNLARPVSLTIKNGGVVKCAYITTSASGVAGSTLTIESGGKLTLSGADGSSNPFSSFSTTNNVYNLNTGSTVEFSGSVAQNIESQLTYSNITFNGSGMKTLNGATTVNGVATFTNGLVTSTSTNVLNMSSTSSASGANNSSFVVGPVQKTGTTDFIFPVGKDLVYRPIAISSLSGSETFNAEYFHTDPNPSYDVTLKDVTLNDIGRCEYWILNRTGASVTATVALSWNTYSCGVDSLPALAVARWDGASWRDEGNTATTGLPDPGTGTVLSGTVASFSPFTLATRSAGVNPLPVELLTFTAHYNSSNTVDLNWTTATETNNDYFTVERSQDGVEFETLDVTDGAGNSTSILNYSIVDANPLQGLSYYRLSQTDFDGTRKYSEIVSVEKNNTGFEITHTAEETPGQLSIYFNCTGNCNVNIELYDIRGRKIYSSKRLALEKESSLTIPVSNFSNGIYLIKATNGSELVFRKIKL